MKLLTGVKETTIKLIEDDLKVKISFNKNYLFIDGK